MPDGVGDGGRAVVIGASMAGLVIARSLTERFEQVTVVDRDRLPDGAQSRSGVPQGRHVHVLLARGGLALESLFPGLLGDLVEEGACAGDVLGAGRWYINGHRLARGRVGQEGILASRPFIEAHVRRRVRALPAVTLVEDCEVAGLTASPDRRRVTGIRMLRRSDGAEQSLAADLVVDCSGRRSGLPAWLEGLGYDPPAVDELRVDVHYRTRQYRLPADALGGDLGCLIAPSPQAPKGAAILRIEGDRWIVMLAGMGGVRPPLDPDGFERYAAGLIVNDVYDAIRTGSPIDDPVPFRFAANLRHRYERLRRFPDALLVAGDAVCSFNPIYGQGMTVAALEAEALRALLATGRTLTPQRWFRAITPVVDLPWQLATGADLAIPQVVGRRRLRVRVLNRYVARLHATAAHDPELAVLFVRVSGMLDRPQRLFSPAVVMRVLRGPVRTANKTPAPVAG